MSPEATTGTSTSDDELGRQRMVGGARVHLLRGARVQRQRRRTRLDEPRPDDQAVARPVAKAAAQLHAHRDVDRLRDRGDDPRGPVGIVEQRRAGTGLRHLPHGAAEVEVDEVCAGGLDHARSLRHRPGLRPEELDRERVLVGSHAQVAERPLVAMLDPRAADHLRADEAGAEATPLSPKRLNADARHRREDEPRRDLDGPDRPGLAKVDHCREW